ncbi:FAS1 domain-containing protein [Chytriomyces sp. MP71]|nr:FAS1 domain-containing protein [Chytriomyces sp. MP71]
MQLKFFAASLITVAHIVNAAGLVDTLTSIKANTLIALVKSEPDILKALSTFKGTLFAPTDAALAATVKAGFNASDLSALAQVLTYHVVPAAFPSADFAGSAYLTTLEGSELKAVKTDSGITINSASVVTSTPYDGGVIHTIDATLIPPANVVNVAASANLTSLISTIKAANLAATVGGLKNVTILAPTDEAFAAIASVVATLSLDQISQILLAHIIPGFVLSSDIVAAKSIAAVPTKDGAETLSVKFDGTNVLISAAGNKAPAKVIAADVLADNVIVHVIDTVLLPNLVSASPSASASYVASTAAASSAPPASKTNLYSGSAISALSGVAASIAAALFL